MKLPIGDNIKRLRTQKGLSQTELSEILGVSCQSISRWETGMCYPDMELLPFIADYFHVTVDDLIGITTEKIKQKEAGYMDSFQKSLSCGEIYECIDIARAAISELPESFILQNALMYALFLSGDKDGNIPEWNSNMQKYDAEITSLGERIMKYCPDQKIRLEATARLAYNHCEMGRREIGRKIYETLPEMLDSRELAIFPAIEEDQQLQHARDVIKKGYKVLIAGMYHLANLNTLSDAEELQVLKIMEQFDSILYEGKYPNSTWHKSDLFMSQAKLLAKMEKNSEALDKVKIAYKAASNYDNQEQDIEIHTLLMGKSVFSRKDVETSDSRCLCDILKEKWLRHPDFDTIRDELYDLFD